MIYVTSDLHGYPLQLFQALLKTAGFCDEDFLFVLGDVIDRGEYGVELLRWMAEQPNVELILGNHEAMLLSVSGWFFDEVTEESLEQLDTKKLALLNNWYTNGAAPTIKGLRKLLKEEPDILEGILDYLQDAPLYDQVTVGGTAYILVHSGLKNFRQDRPLEDYSPAELLWERPDLNTRYFPDATVIFGHTPTEFFGPQYAGKMVKTPTWFCIDTGAATGNKPMLLRLDDGKEFY